MMEHPKSALRHLWAAIQVLRRAEDLFSEDEISNLVPVYDAVLRLDFLTQKLVPYSSSSLQDPVRAMMQTPFWKRISPEFCPIYQADRVAVNVTD